MNKTHGYKGWVKGYSKVWHSPEPTVIVDMPFRLTKGKANKALAQIAKRLHKQGMETIKHCYQV
jgi:alpha/beta superfamily hydrolase